jgi:hypothetical protein
VTAETTIVGAAPSARAAFRLSRYDATGALDTTFGIGGTVVTLIEANNAVGGVAIQPDGRIIVSGHATADMDPTFPQSAIVDVAVAGYFGDPAAASSP